MSSFKLFGCLLLAGTALAAPALANEPEPRSPDATLEELFADPPVSARPRVWWHWMNGNITKDGIARDMAWMKRVGIAGLQNFDANQKTPQVVADRLVYMTPEWTDAFRFAAAEAERQGLELAIASSPGWSETGGPWVKPEDGIKKLVWSATDVEGGRRFVGKLSPPPAVTGPFQGLTSAGEPGAGINGPAMPAHYADVAVLAIPSTPVAIATPVVRGWQGNVLDAAAMFDDNLVSDVEIAAGGSADSPRMINFDYDRPQTIRSARLFAPKAKFPLAGPIFKPRLEARDESGNWQFIADLPLGDVPTTASFAPVKARSFRIVLAPRTEAVETFRSFGPDVVQMMGGNLNRAFAMPVRIAEVELSGRSRVDRAEAKAGYSLVPDYFALSRGVADAPGVAIDKIVNLTARMRDDGSLDWTPPAGNWTIMRFGYSLTGKTNHPAPPEATGLEVDKFDGAAVRRYMEHYLAMYRDASGGLIGDRGVQAMLTDSIEVGATNWTPRMIEQFQRLRGYDPTPWLPALAGEIVGSRQQSDAFLYDFRRTLSELIATEHYGTVAAVAHENGLTVYGEALEDKRPVIGDDMAMRRFADIPMAAMWTFPREQGPRETLLADIKGAASVAHVYGQNLVAAESLTAAGPLWGFAPSDLKRIIDLEFVVGVNRPVIHTSVHAPVDDKVPGLSLGGIGQYFNRHETWAEMAKPWIDYLARNSLMLQQGRHVADVAYFYGEEAPLTGLWGEKQIADAPKGYGYDFVNAEILTSVLTNDGPDLVTSGGARYRALYLGGQSHQMTVPALRRLAALVSGGATVIGEKPSGNPSLAGDPAEWKALVGTLWGGDRETRHGKGRVIASRNVEAALQEIGLAPDFHYTGGQSDTEILFLHRKLSDGDSYFLSNRRDRAETVEARFRVTGKAPEVWRAETGLSRPVSYRIENGETVVPLTLEADGSIHVVFRRPAQADKLTVPSSDPVPHSTLEGAWQVAFQTGRGAPSSATLPRLAPLNENGEPGIKYFSGVATYSKAFTAPKDWKPGQPLWLDLGEVGDLAEVWVNGNIAGTAWHAPYRVDIGKQAKRGKNRIEVKVANLWVNRMIGDAQPDATKVTWTGLQPYPADAPLRRSGLIGPVRLMVGRQ
ncbi:MAG: glycoside hydrolase [Novosphingobium sp.]|nr:glycoside hydrolase [Novosphingobium sp.]